MRSYHTNVYSPPDSYSPHDWRKLTTIVELRPKVRDAVFDHYLTHSVMTEDNLKNIAWRYYKNRSEGTAEYSHQYTPKLYR